MATKPAVLPRSWADNAVYDSGPFIGSTQKIDPGVGIAASGHRPGAAFPTPAEYENYQQYHITDWIRTWVFLGSSAGAANPHIVEADASGHSALVALTLADTVDETVLDVTAVNSLAPAVLVTTSGGGAAYQAVIPVGAIGYTTSITGGSDSTGFDVSMNTTLSSAAGFRATMGALAAGDGLKVDNLGAGNGIHVTGTATGINVELSGGVSRALEVTGSPSAASAATMTGGTGQVLNITGLLGALAAKFLGGSTAGTDAILATTGNNTGNAIVAAVPNTATSGARGFYCTTGTSAAAAAEFVAAGTGASGNYAAILTGDTTSPTKGIALFTPQNADPSGGGVSGGVAMSTAKGMTLGNFSDGTWRSVWHSLDGYTCAYTSGSPPANISTIGGIGVWRVVGEITTSANGNFVKVAGATILLRVSMTPRATTAAVANTFLGVKIEDTTGAPNPVFTRTGAGTGDTAGYRITDGTTHWGMSIAFVVQLAVPATGTRSYTLSINTSSATEIRVRDVTMDFVGTVD